MKTTHLPNEKGEITTAVEGFAITGVNKITVIDLDKPQITSKKVTRWYLDGKGYASRKFAYKKLAYQYLLTEVLGKVENGRRENLKDLNDDEVKETMTRLFAEKFPHEVDPRCDYVCRKTYSQVYDDYNGPDEVEDGFAFDSCKAAQQTWIKNKAEELYET